MAVTCINLKERFGKRYRIRTEAGQRTRDPWLFLIPCRRGEISPYGDDLLLACTSHRGNLPRMLIEAGCTITQDGDDGVNATFPVSNFAKVARVMKPRRRRQVSVEERQRLVEMGKRVGFASSEREPTYKCDRSAHGQHETTNAASGLSNVATQN